MRPKMHSLLNMIIIASTPGLLPPPVIIVDLTLRSLKAWKMLAHDACHRRHCDRLSEILAI